MPRQPRIVILDGSGSHELLEGGMRLEIPSSQDREFTSQRKIRVDRSAPGLVFHRIGGGNAIINTGLPTTLSADFAAIDPPSSKVLDTATTCYCDGIWYWGLASRYDTDTGLRVPWVQIAFTVRNRRHPRRGPRVAEDN